MTSGFSVVIPAHNEAAVIEGTLQSLLDSRLDRPLQIIVVANGCSDDTAAKARAFAAKTGGPIEVVDTPVGGKANALNLGDRAAKFFPRAYLDGDTKVSPDALQKVAEALSQPPCHLAAPTAERIYNGRNPFLRGYYNLWGSLPYVANAIQGSGFYAINETLHARFTEFPPITNDDKFIRDLATDAERRVIPGCHTFIQMPATFADLIKVKTRWSYGAMELAATRPDLLKNDHQRRGLWRHLLTHPQFWLHVPTFFAISFIANRAAKKRLAQKHPVRWERDDSTRSLAA